MSARRRRKRTGRRRVSLRIGAAAAALVAAFCAFSVWFVRHPRAWHEQTAESWPGFVTSPLYRAGNAICNITDGLGWTGHDAVYSYDVEAPSGSVLFAGAPRRTGAPAPDDITVLDRGNFKLGWSPKLRHPVWCAYRVAKEALHEVGRRPPFSRDKSAPASPAPSDYARSGYDRGHMAPNYAIASRYGAAEQKATFLMSNVAPQTPSLNRGPWREMEHRIADLWTARYGEIWVITGCIPDAGGETICGTGIDVPASFYQIVVAQEGLDVRALAVHLPQTVRGDAYPARYITSIDEIEELSGLDFLPDLPEFIQSPLEAEVPSRLWPVRLRDIIRLVALRFRR